MNELYMNELFEFGGMFLITNGLFFAGLGATEASNEKLKTGLSLAGLIISILWFVCTIDIANNLQKTLTMRGLVLVYMPLAFIVGWLFSMRVHICNWRRL